MGRPDAKTSAEPRSLLVDPSRAAELKDESLDLPSWDLTFRQVWDLELLVNGAFSPLEGYLGQADYTSVCKGMRLSDGTLWPIPICLDVTEAFAEAIAKGDRVVLRHPEGMALGVLTIEDLWRPDPGAEASALFGTEDDDHPGVQRLFRQTNPVYVGGAIEGLDLPQHHTFRHLRHTPLQLRRELKRVGWERVVAFQTRNPMHRAHVELTRLAAAEIDGNVLLQPVVGRTSPGDVGYFTRVRCYEAVLDRYPPQSVMLSLLPLAMRMAGPREAVWHALVRRNYGASHFIVGRDHAGSRTANGKPFYAPDAARELAEKHADEMGIGIVSSEEMAYTEATGLYVPVSEVPKDAHILTLSTTELRGRLRQGADIPEWFSYPEVIEELRHRFPPRDRQGFTVFFTGLSGAGKSTVAQLLMAKLLEIQHRPVTLLDGDIVRTNLSSELGFSAEHRDLNIRRIGFVASEITKNFGVAICAPIAPYAQIRREIRDTIEQYGGFIEVFVSTPLEVCEERDRKGLYAKARAGLVKNFTGIDDPYEEPERAEVVLDTSDLTAEEAARKVALFLQAEGYVGPQAE